MTPSTKCSCSGSPPILANGRTTIEARPGGFFGCPGRRGLRTDFERIDADRFGNILELRRPEVGDCEIEPPLHLTVRVFGQANRAGLCDAFQSCGDIDVVAHQVAVGLFDHVSQMDADAEFDAALGRKTGVAFDEAGLHLGGAAHRIDHAAKFDQAAVTSSLDDASVMQGDGRIDEVAAQRPEPRQGAILIRPHERL